MYFGLFAQEPNLLSHRPIFRGISGFRVCSLGLRAYRASRIHRRLAEGLGFGMRDTKP